MSIGGVEVQMDGGGLCSTVSERPIIVVGKVKGPCQTRLAKERAGVG